MALNDPRSSLQFESAAGIASLPDVSQAAVMIGCAQVGAVAAPLVLGEASDVRAEFAESLMSRFADDHFALDPVRHPVGFIRAAHTTAGVTTLVTSGVTGTSVVTATGGVEPNGRYDVYAEVLVGGTIGADGIVIGVSIDGGRTIFAMRLGTATSLLFPNGVGVSLSFAAGTLNTGDVVTGYTEPRKWSAAQLKTAADSLSTTTFRFSLLGVAEQVLASEAATLIQILDDLRARKIFARCVFQVRNQYRQIVETNVSATFDDTTRTITRAAGSFVTAGYKPGMRVTVSGSVSNNGTFIKILTVAATVLTFTTNVVFVDEGPETIDILAQETDADYAANIVSEWSQVEDPRLFGFVKQIRATAPFDQTQLDQDIAPAALARYIAEPIEVNAGQREVVGSVGGALKGRLGGRIYEGTARIHYDAKEDGSLVINGSRFTAVQSAEDFRAGAFLTEQRSLYAPNSQEDTMVKGRLVDAWNSIVLVAETTKILTGQAADPADLNKLSEKARQELENYFLRPLRQFFRGKISNVDSVGDQQLLRVLSTSNLNVGISVAGYIVTLAYILRFNNVLTVRAPGQVG